MNYRIVMPNHSTYDYSSLGKFLIASKKKYSIIKFTQNETAEFFRVYPDLYKDEEEKSHNIANLSEGFLCIGDDGNSYIVTPESAQKIDFKITLSKSIKKSKRLYHLLKKSYDSNEKLLSSATETCLSVKPSKTFFKKAVYVNKEKGYALRFRFKQSKKENQPLLILICGKRFVRSHLWHKLKKYDCSVLIPQMPAPKLHGKNGYAHFPDALKPLTELLGDKYKTDKNRIYISGISAGAELTWLCIHRFPEFFACGVPIMGAATAIDNPDYSRFKNTPLWVAHAENDKTVLIDYNDCAVKEIIALDGNIKYTRYKKGGHGIAPRFFKKENWDEWMFCQSLKNR